MRKSVITASAKNVRSLSGRRRIATVAAGVVLAGGVQFLVTDSAWACGEAELYQPLKASTDLGLPVAPDAAFTSAGSTVAADGSWNQLTVKVANRTGVDAHGAEPNLLFGTVDGKGAIGLKNLVVEMKDHNGAWKRMSTTNTCRATIGTEGTQRQRLDNGTAATYTFRFALAAGTPDSVTSINVATAAWSAGAKANGDTDLRTVKVTHPKAPAAKPTTQPTAKPTAAAKPAAAKPAADTTTAPAAKTPATPATATPSTPATTAPAGAPELAQTGADTPNGFLLATSAALLALGAGVMIAVRRLRPQR